MSAGFQGQQAEYVVSDLSPPRASPATTHQLCHRLTATLAARLYLDNCNACRFTDGHGAKSVFRASTPARW
jgi:hypothetical protein